MEEEILSIQKLNALPGSMIILTFGSDYHLDEINNSFRTIKESFPQYHFVPNIKGLITNITVIEDPLTNITLKEEIPSCSYRSPTVKEDYTTW